MEEKTEHQENRFVSEWLKNRLTEDPSSAVIKAIGSALDGETLDEPKLLKALETLATQTGKDGSD